MPVDVEAFFSRIGLRLPVRPDFESLRAIHWDHLQTVSFENLDIRPLGLPVGLDIESIEEKIVGRMRGGFCYELNELLAEVLTQLGFGVTRVSARFLLADGQFTPPFDHMALLVQQKGSTERWLVDVGCARTSPAFPLPLDVGSEERHIETGSSYRLSHADTEWQLAMKECDAEWKAQYRFAETPYDLSAFADRCRFQWSDPELHFTQGALCSMNLNGGRITLTDSSLIHTQHFGRTEKPISHPADFYAALVQHFGITL